MRKAIEEPMQKFVARHFHKLDAISDEFVNRVVQVRNRQLEVPGNFAEDIYKWTMESLCVMLLNQKFEYFCAGGLGASSEAVTLLDNLKSATEAIRKCESGLYSIQYLLFFVQIVKD